MLLGVDVGGTFTDAVLVDDASAIHTAKVPSTPAQQSLAVLEAVRLVLEHAGAHVVMTRDSDSASSDSINPSSITPAA